MRREEAGCGIWGFCGFAQKNPGAVGTAGKGGSPGTMTGTADGRRGCGTDRGRSAGPPDLLSPALAWTSLNSCSRLNCTCFPHPVLSSRHTRECPALPCTPETHDTPRLEERPLEPAARVLLAARIGKVLGIPQRPPLCLAPMPISGPAAPCRCAGHSLARRRLSGPRTRGNAPSPAAAAASLPDAN